MQQIEAKLDPTLDSQSYQVNHFHLEFSTFFFLNKNFKDLDDKQQNQFYL
jgi:hypothetical protein